MTDVILYITLSIAWSVGCLGIGYFLGKKARDSLGETVTNPLSESEERTPRPVPWYRKAQALIGGLVVLVGAGTLTNYYVFDAQTSEIVRCQEIWTNGFATALEARTKANQEVANAQDELWKLFQEGLRGGPPSDIRARFQAQLDKYLQGRDQTKAAPPYPEAPRDLCS